MAALRLELDSDASDAIDGRQIRAVAFQEVRLDYVRRVLTQLGRPVGEARTLVVGSGRGLLARGLARLGLDITAVDPSPAATHLAEAEAAREGLRIVHRIASAERMGLTAGEFDLVVCADTLEITDDLDGVLGEIAALLRPGGVIVYDTVNRTPISRLIYLGVFQTFRGTRIMPSGRYSSRRLRRPDELVAALEWHGLRNEDICSFKPKDPRSLVRAVLARRRGEITDEQIPAIVDFVLEPEGHPIVTYLGHALKGQPSA